MLVSCRGTTHRKKHMRLDQAHVGVGMEVDGCWNSDQHQRQLKGCGGHWFHPGNQHGLLENPQQKWMTILEKWVFFPCETSAEQSFLLSTSALLCLGTVQVSWGIRFLEAPNVVKPMISGIITRQFWDDCRHNYRNCWDNHWDYDTPSPNGTWLAIIILKWWKWHWILGVRHPLVAVLRVHVELHP